jgi:hypothetical protein
VTQEMGAPQAHLEQMLAEHAGIVRAAAISYARFRDAQDAHQIDRQREHQSYDAIAALIAKAVEDRLGDIDQRYDPVGLES